MSAFIFPSQEIQDYRSMMSSSGSYETIDWNSVTTQIDRVRAASFFNRRGLCKNKRVLPCRRVNWDMARESGIWDHLKDWLVQGGYEDGELTYTCRALENATNMNKPVYREVYL
ncbi:hypothetical protein L2E82_49015 [Cichorium intybus]|uniref:Uncharacterized protein n=1 Tax=Cichorium intybus TaxID=13427 RepID=A0ACB8YZS5_CICIN|nr:hypothetical protein L2E82_49015 [Cichorium intybus]